MSEGRTGSDPVDVAGFELRRPWAVAVFAAVVAAAGFGFSQLLPLAAFRGLDVGASLPPLAATAVQLLLIELVGFGGASWFYLRLRGLPPSYVGLRWPTLRDAGWIVGGSLLIVVLYYAIVIAAVLAGVEIEPTAVGEFGMRNPRGLLLIAFLSIVLVGPMEELFFRGIVQGTMREAMPAKYAIPLASAAFAAVHVFSFRGQAVLLGSLFLTSLVLGYAYERTGNLWVAAGMHGGYNAIVALLAYLVLVSGVAPNEAAAVVLP